MSFYLWFHRRGPKTIPAAQTNDYELMTKPAALAHNRLTGISVPFTVFNE
jgi:hypothetical protein